MFGTPVLRQAAASVCADGRCTGRLVSRQPKFLWPMDGRAPIVADIRGPPGVGSALAAPRRIARTREGSSGSLKDYRRRTDTRRLSCEYTINPLWAIGLLLRHSGHLRQQICKPPVNKQFDYASRYRKGLRCTEKNMQLTAGRLRPIAGFHASWVGRRAGRTGPRHLDGSNGHGRRAELQVGGCSPVPDEPDGC